MNRVNRKRTFKFSDEYYKNYTGKTVLQHALARFADADVIIMAACGERANEVVRGQVFQRFCRTSVYFLLSPIQQSRRRCPKTVSYTHLNENIELSEEGEKELKTMHSTVIYISQYVFGTLRFSGCEYGKTGIIAGTTASPL